MIKAFCLLFVAVCSIVFMTSMTAFAAHTDGSMEVIARIETVPNETTNPTTNGSSSDFQYEGNVSTGDAVYVCVVIALFVLMISTLVIFLCINNKEHR